MFSHAFFWASHGSIRQTDSRHSYRCGIPLKGRCDRQAQKWRANWQQFGYYLSVDTLTCNGSICKCLTVCVPRLEIFMCVFSLMQMPGYNPAGIVYSPSDPTLPITHISQPCFTHSYPREYGGGKCVCVCVCIRVCACV